jgi:hypothetical protein
MEGINPAKIFCKHICKYHNVSPVQLSYDSKINEKKQTKCQSKISGDIAQLVKCLSRKHKAMISNLSPPKIKGISI